MKKKFTIKTLLILAVLAMNFAAKSQMTFTTWTHPPYITLYAQDTSAGVSTSANISMDDIYSNAVVIGFPFTFYGNTYNTCAIGANGNISFDSASVAGYDPWPISQVLLGNTSVKNSICGVWCDMDMADYGGTISYCITGTAPNRIFGINYCHNGMYTSASCPGQSTTTQMLLYEGSNNIEVHVAHKSVCPVWNGGLAVIGVQNSAGTDAVVAPGRDYPDTFSCTNEAWLFSPSGSSYTVSSIPFSPVHYYTVFWYDSTTGGYLGSGDSLLISDSLTTAYIAYAVGCSDTASTGFDSVSHGFFRVISLNASNVATARDFRFYPNPATEVLNIVGNTPILSVSISDITGREVYYTDCNTFNLAVPIKELSNGLYSVKLNNMAVKRFLKE